MVLAPPNGTTTLYYCGSLRGLGTPAPENQDGIGAAMRIVSASTPDEVKELIDRRNITRLVVPSQDSYLAEYAHAGTGQLEGTFRDQLRFSTLRPLAYHLPTIAGFDGQSAMVLEVGEEQEEATALSRIASYFVEMGKLDQAAAAAQELQRFPSDLGAWARLMP